MKTFSNPPDSNHALQRYSLHGETMGTTYSAVFFAPPNINKTALQTHLFAAVDAVDQQMSNWKPNSDLSRLNRAPENQWVTVPKEMFEVIETALLISQQSQGAFDIGVGNLVEAWGFGPSKGQTNQQQIRTLKTRPYKPATELLEIDPAQRRVLKRAAITLDLSGIAKGYGVDQLALCLNNFGITRYLVGIDGEMRARGIKPEGQPWTIAIEKPVRHQREVMGVMELTDAAIATSGVYRHWVELKDKTYPHIMNGARCEPTSNRLASVTVVESSSMLADAWATALLVLGETAGIELAQSRGMDALFVLYNGDEFQQISVAAGQIER